MGDSADEGAIEQYERLKQSDGFAELPPAERFRKTSHIALLLAYDLIDKIRYSEKESVKLPEQELEQRHQQLTKAIDQLREAYLTFTELGP